MCLPLFLVRGIHPQIHFMIQDCDRSLPGTQEEKKGQGPRRSYRALSGMTCSSHIAPAHSLDGQHILFLNKIYYYLEKKGQMEV